MYLIIFQIMNYLINIFPGETNGARRTTNDEKLRAPGSGENLRPVLLLHYNLPCIKLLVKYCLN
jgi:hypothetical protein